MTSLNQSLKWPGVIGDVTERFDGLTVDLDSLRLVEHVQFVVGEQDVQHPGKSLPEWRTEQQKDDESELSSATTSLPIRTEAIANLREELSATGVKVQYGVVPGAAHEALKVFQNVTQFLEDVSNSNWLCEIPIDGMCRESR